MLAVKTIDEVRRAVREAKKNGKRVGLVPTMGALHQGHMSLVRAAKTECDFVVLSVFVNPIQFGPNEDFEKYPRPIEKDLALCRQAGVDVVFHPEVKEMYSRELLTTVNVSKMTQVLCGRSRPTHFQGVTTVVTKLFNIVNPDFAYFGQKDAQQALVLRRMVMDLDVPITLRICPTIRETTGLAKSSRNQYLSDAQRAQATCLSRSLKEVIALIKAGKKKTPELISAMETIITSAGPCRIDYISFNDLETLEEVSEVRSPVVVALAVNIGPARLIDNIMVDADGNEIIMFGKNVG
jgi:pantoate--beta-alanine ligase